MSDTNANMVCRCFLLSALLGVASAQGATLSGTLKLPDGVTALSGLATVRISGGLSTNTFNGIYSLTVTNGWSGFVVVERPNEGGAGNYAAFNPPYRAYTNVTINQTSQDFTMLGGLGPNNNFRTISGTATNSMGQAALDVLLVASTNGGAALTSTNGAYNLGYYFFGSGGNWSGTVTPQRVFTTFTPISRPYTAISAAQSNQNYLAGSGGGGATLAITKSADNTSVTNGQVVAFALVVTNLSSSIASNVLARDVLSTNLLWIGGSGGVYDSGSRTVTWTIGTFPPHAGTNLAFSAMVSTSAVAWTVITNSAQVMADACGTNNGNTVSLTVRGASCSIPGGGHFGADGFGSYGYNPDSSLRISSRDGTLTNYFAWEAPRIAAAGITWNRTLSPTDGQFSWDKVEFTQGFYDWTQADALVRACQTNNIHILALVQCGTPWDGSLTNANGSFTYLKPNNTNAYKAFLTAMVARYNGDGTNDMPGLQPGYAVKHWEISNEPEGYFGGVTNAPQQYLDYFEVLKMSYETIKQADPGAVVMNGGAFPIVTSLAGTTMVSVAGAQFWNYVLGTLGGSNYTDVLNVHYGVPYVGVPLEIYMAQWQQFRFNKPIWVTESGFSTGVFTDGGTTYPDRTPSQQCALWVEQCCYGLAHNVQKMFWAPFYHDESGFVPDWFANAAMVNSNRTLNLIYTAQQTMAAKLDAFTSATEVAYTEVAGTNTAGRYIFQGTNPVCVLWDAAGGTANVSGDFGAGLVRVTDVVGNISTQSSSAVALGSTPVYVEATSVTLTTSAGAHGSITPPSTNVLVGGNATFTIAGSNYYRILTVTTNSADTGLAFDNTSISMYYTWSNVQAAGVLGATFTQQCANAPGGTPYWWLAGYYPGTNDFDAAALSDTDRDGLKAWQEYVADTDPTNAASNLRITAISNYPSFRVYFTSSTQRWYSLGGRADLTAGDWTNVATQADIHGVGGIDSLQDTNAANKRFYRVEVKVTP